MKTFLSLSVVIAIQFTTVLTQVCEDFSDLNIHSNPQWIGDTSLFYVNPEVQLQLNNKGIAGKSSISTCSRSINNATWDFFVKLKFNPSSSNYCNIYLVSDSIDLKKALNGYFVKIGNTTDEVSLYRQDGEIQTEIIDGRDDVTDCDSVMLNIRVKRDNSGNWELYSKTEIDDCFMLEGKVTDNIYYQSDYYGIVCIYSKTRAEHFYFDNIIVTGEPYKDTIPPMVDDFMIINKNKLWVKFSKEIDFKDSGIFANFQIKNLFFADSIFPDFNIENSYYLIFPSDFIFPVEYTLNISSVCDLAGNFILDTSIYFQYTIPGYNHLVINEIMADPTPVLGLPEFEYIELKNNTNCNINIGGWKLKIGKSFHTFPDAIILPDSYLIICQKNTENEFEKFGIPIAILNSNELTNSGNTIVIYNQNGNIIDSIYYSDFYYQNEIKRNGGWSIERVYPYDKYGRIDNWKASIDESGGTPGSKNSVFDSLAYKQSLKLENYTIKSANRIEFIFSKELSKDSVNIANFIIKNKAIIPSEIQIEYYKIIVVLNENIPPNEPVYIEIMNIKDVYGNVINISTKLEYFKPQIFDILITEIMADPEPAVGLSEYEYIELYNRSEKAINIEGWLLKINTKYYTLPAFIIQGSDYSIIINNDAKQYFNSENTICVSGFSNISNSGSSIELYDKDTNLVHFMNFSDKWYHNILKQDGGWSLEMIDPLNPCGQEENWTASLSKKGGTPGQENSVFYYNTDIKIPQLKHIGIPDSSIIQLFFDESLNPGNILETNNYLIDKQIGNPVNISYLSPDYSVIELKLPSNLNSNEKYKLTIKNYPEDCSGNMAEIVENVEFSLPDSFCFNDLIINEVLFNPVVGCEDFLEIYNRSDKIFDLNKLIIATRDYETGNYNNFCKIVSVSYLIYPHEYFVFSNNREIIQQYYTCENKDKIIEIVNMPNFPDDKGRIVLLDNLNNLIDELSYSEKMHYNLLTDKEGVSLERIDPEKQTNDKSNWHSAAETAGYATPTYKNSHYLENKFDEKSFLIKSKTFSPDNDGYEDYLEIHYNIDEPGTICSLIIFDTKGRRIKILADNVMLETDGIFLWDGTDDFGIISQIGIYIIYIHIFDLKGNVKEYKMPCVLARKIN